MPKKRPITAEDLLKLKFVDGVTISPDEREIVITLRTITEDRKKYESHLYLINIDGSGLRQLTFGEISDSPPVFSPDGKWLAFVSKRGDKKGIYLMARDGGEPKVLSDKDGDFSDLAFSPDSRTLVCVFRKADEVPKNKEGKKEDPVYRHITRLYYKSDNYGFLPKEEGQIWSFDIATGEGRKLSTGARAKSAPVFSPDGRYLAYLSNIQPDPDKQPDIIDLFCMPAGGGKARKIETPQGPKMMPRFSPDGKWIAYLGHDNPHDSWGVTNWHVWKVPIRGGQALDLTPKLDRMCYDETISDTVEAHAAGALNWSQDGKYLFFQVTDAGSTHLYRLEANGRRLESILSGKLHVMGASFGNRCEYGAVVISTHTTPAEVYALPLKTRSKPKQLTQFNKDLLTEVRVGKPEEVIVSGHDGYPIHGWILKPPDFNPRKRYPSILQIHGGPRVQYGNTFFHEMQLLAACGYVVYFGNPRGGQGYGEKHADFITNAWGTVDYDDCMAFADFMSRQSYIDVKRMGVTGGSYGGYMTNWIIGHTNRFRAAVTQRSVVNLESMFGSSDIGFHLPREIRGTPYSNFDDYRRQSPLTHVKNIRTPLLILHSEQDLRCPIEQAEQLFISLKMLGRTVEFVRFPNEPHGLSRCGRPDRRLERLNWILKWFNRYLKSKRT